MVTGGNRNSNYQTYLLILIEIMVLPITNFFETVLFHWVENEDLDHTVLPWISISGGNHIVSNLKGWRSGKANNWKTSYNKGA